MKIILGFFAFFTLTAFSCFFTRREQVASIKNASPIRFDSIVLYVSNCKFKIDGLDTGQTKQITFPTDTIKTMNEVIYNFQAYRHDTLVTKSYNVLGDYGHLPKRVDVTINDTLAFFYKIQF